MEGKYCKDIKDIRISLNNGNNVYVDEELYYEDNDEIEAKTLNGHTKEVIALLKLQQDKFLSISLDHTMIIWSSKGRKQASLNNEQGVLGFSEIGDSKLLTINEDETVTMWSLKNKKIKDLSS